MNDFVFGRYSADETIIHKVDARNKILLMILLMVTIFFQFKVWSTTLIISGLLLIVLIVIMIISKTSFIALLKSLKSMWLMLLILLVIYIFLPNSTYKIPAFKIGDYQIYWDALLLAGYIFLRIIMFLCITMILTTTTKPMDLTYAFEWYLTPLKVVKFPSHAIAMTMSIALRFIPTILMESKRIMNAQASRGVDFQHGGLVKKAKATFTLVIPLFVSAFERSEDLSNAMIARAYDPNAKRSRYRILHFGLVDLISLLIVLAIFTFVLLLFIKDQNGGLNIIEILFGFKPPF